MSTILHRRARRDDGEHSGGQCEHDAHLIVSESEHESAPFASTSADDCKRLQVNEIIAWRMAKAQQMHRSRATVQPFPDVRTAVLNDTFEGAFRRRHPGFDPPTTTGDQQPPQPDHLP